MSLLRELERECRRKGRSIDLCGLRFPDIVAYIDDDVIRRIYDDDFPGWARVVRRFKDRPVRPSFKAWVLQEYGVDLTSAHRVRVAVKEMAALPQKRQSDLSRVVHSILVRAHESRWSSQTYSAHS